MTMWTAITSFGDSALLLPLIAWIAICLLLPVPGWREARRWVIAATICGGGVMLSKLLFMAWGIGPPGLNYTGFSGHTALAILVWPTLAGVLSLGGTRRQRLSMIALGACMGAAVAVSRLVLEVHSPSEVWLGAILGTAVVTWFLRGPALRESPARSADPWRLALLGGGALAIGLVCYGRVFPSQHVLQDIALWLSGHPNVFTRRVGLG
jgi:membrane-associated phospholipid phosphatase